jgi:hypothetical protein
MEVTGAVVCRWVLVVAVEGTFEEIEGQDEEEGSCDPIASH